MVDPVWVNLAGPALLSEELLPLGEDQAQDGVAGHQDVGDLCPLLLSHHHIPLVQEIFSSSGIDQSNINKLIYLSHSLQSGLFVVVWVTCANLHSCPGIPIYPVSDSSDANTSLVLLGYQRTPWSSSYKTGYHSCSVAWDLRLVRHPGRTSILLLG